MNRAVQGIVAACLFAGLGCGTTDLPDGERRQVVREIASSVVLPTLDDWVAKTDALGNAATQFADAPTTTGLQDVRQAWRDARAAWKESGAFLFGPAVDLETSDAVDWSPVDPNHVEADVAGSAELTDAYVDALGTNRKGFHALEYMLFDASGSDDAIWSAMTTSVTADRRRLLLAALASHIHRRAVELRDDWVPGGGNYFDKFTQPGRPDSPFPTVKAALDGIVNQSVYLSELVADSRIGKPLGTGEGGVAQPYLEESPLSDNSIADMLGNLRGIRNAYFGTTSGAGGKGLTVLIAANSPRVDIGVKRAIGEAIRLVESIPTPYRTALLEDRDTVQAAYEAVKTLKRSLATDVVATLGATLTFNGNDGD